MRRLIAGTAILSVFSTALWASSEMDVTAPELAPAKTSFAYRARHGAEALTGATLSALWFSGDDRELPQSAVIEPIVEVPAQAARPIPSRNALCNHAVAVAAEHDLPAPFFANLIQQESGFKSHVVSPAGAQGIAQFMPRVARAYGLENPFEPLHALSASAKLLRDLLGQFGGNLGLAAAAYNAGPKRVQDWMARRGKLPDETRNYVRSITGHPAERWARVSARTEGTRLPAHARCANVPVMEVAIPEAAPVKVAKKDIKNGKGKTKETMKVAAATKELPKLSAAKAEGPKLAAAKSYTLASVSPGKQVAVINGGKIRIMAPEKGKKPAAAKVAVAAKEAKPKPAAKLASKSQQKQTGKRVKIAAAR